MRSSGGPRYAIYYAPESRRALWRFGSAVIGYDAATGLDVPPPENVRLDAAWHRLTEEPRRYGFHATLKAPFHLGRGLAEVELLEAAREFASVRRPIEVPRLAVVALGGFVALVPADARPSLTMLAADCVRGFDRFRAPLSDDDRARRLAAPLSERQARHLDEWGYPFVFEDFRFHMTLSGSLPPERRESDRRELERAYANIASRLSIDAVTVFRQAHRGERFRVLERCPFGA